MSVFQIMFLLRNEERVSSDRKRTDLMREAMSLCIKMNLKFTPIGLETVQNQVGRTWLTGLEGYYAEACLHKNASAARSFAYLIGRREYRWNGPIITWIDPTVKPLGRLFEGAHFTWDGTKVKVTSLHPDHLIACAYESSNSAPGRYKVIKRFKITYKDLKEANKANLKQRNRGTIVFESTDD